MKKNTANIFYTLPEIKLREIISQSHSLSQVFDKLGMCKTGPQYRVLKQRIQELNIDISHFKQRFIHGRFEKRPIKEHLIENSPITSTHGFKLRLIKEGLLENKCYECDNGAIWNNKPLSLQLDHKNGIRNDNRIENLRILCPNCHTQTHTYSGKKHKKHHFCKTCGNSLKSKTSKNCRKCANIESAKTNPLLQVKISWPLKDELEKLIWTKPPKHLSKDLKCSPNAITGHCKKIGIVLPPKGYWIRRNYGYSHELALNPPPKKITQSKRAFTEQELYEIRQMLDNKISCRKIGRKFHVAHTTISAIKRNKTQQYKLGTGAGLDPLMRVQ